MLETNRLVKCGRKLPGKCRTMIRKVKVKVRIKVEMKFDLALTETGQTDPS